MTVLPWSFKKRMVSPIIARFSSGLARNTSVTCNSHVLPTMVTTGVFASRICRINSSFSTATPLRRVMLNAAILAFFHLRRLACAKNSMSLGFEPGQPPSM